MNKRQHHPECVLPCSQRLELAREDGGEMEGRGREERGREREKGKHEKENSHPAGGGACGALKTEPGLG